MSNRLKDTMETIEAELGLDDEETRRQAAGLALAFAIGALVGVGLAVTWIPGLKRRPAPAIVRGYRRAREASGAALSEARQWGSDLAAEFREELAANIEAAREEFVDMARKQLGSARKTLEKEYGKFRR